MNTKWAFDNIKLALVVCARDSGKLFKKNVVWKKNIIKLKKSHLQSNKWKMEHKTGAFHDESGDKDVMYLQTP